MKAVLLMDVLDNVKGHVLLGVRENVLVIVVAHAVQVVMVVVTLVVMVIVIILVIQDVKDVLLLVV